MRLFGHLCRLRRKMMPNGDIFRGKNRLVKQVTREDIQKLKNSFEIEEKNMFYLRHPFLTLEESMGHAKALGKPDERYLKVLQPKKPGRPNTTIEGSLAHLRFSEKWE